jgi:hypothetical protein
MDPQQKIMMEFDEEMTIQELGSFKMDLTYDRLYLLQTNYFGQKMSTLDFVRLFGIRPIKLTIDPKTIINYFGIKNFRLRQTSIRKLKNTDLATPDEIDNDDSFYLMYKGHKVFKFDYKMPFLIHPKYAKVFFQFYKMTPIRAIMEALEFVSIAVVDREEDPFLYIENYIKDNGEQLSIFELAAFYTMIGDDMINRFYESNEGPHPNAVNLITYSKESNIQDFKDEYEKGQLAYQQILYDLPEDLHKDAEAIEVEFLIENSLEPLIQNPLPSRAELERDYRDFINARKNNKAGIPKDKKKSKKCKVKGYDKEGNSKRCSFNFYNPNFQLRKLKVKPEAMETLTFCSKFVKKPVGFWVKGVQEWLQRTSLEIEDALQLFANFNANETASDSEFAIGSMTNFHYTPRRISYYGVLASQAENMQQAWKQQLDLHYNKNGHHPEYLEYFRDPLNRMSVKDTIECWFDLLASAMRISNNANEAFYKMLGWVFEFDSMNVAKVKPKFQKLNPHGTAFFIAVVADRGLSIHDCKKVHPRLRNAPLTPEEEKVDLLSLYNRNYPLVRSQKESSEFLKLPKVKDYLNETNAHVELVNRELIKYRISPRHDADKFNFQSIVAYVYQWSWPKVTGTSAFDDFLEEKEKPEPVKEAKQEGEFVDAKDAPGLMTKVRNGIANAFSSLHNKALTPIAEPLQKATDKALEILMHMQGLFTDLYNKITKFFTNLTGLGLPKLTNVTTIISLVMDYLIFINVDNVLLKGAIVMSALSKLGISSILSKASEYLKGFINLTPDQLPENVVEGTSEDGEKSSFWTKIVEWITDINPRNAGILVGLIVSGLMGYSVFANKDLITDFGEKVSKGMRSMSFVGMGFVGAGNIVKYVASIFKTAADWMRKKVGLMTEEDKKDEEAQNMVKEILKWAQSLDFYSSADGLELMKNSRQEFDNGKKIAQAYFFYNSMTHDQKLNMSPHLKQEIKLRAKKSMDILNFLHRLDASTHFRQTPFHVQLYGEAGVGKSELLKELIRKFHAKYFSNVDISKFVYSPNTNKQHWDGYWGQLCIVIDEMWAVLDAETLTEWLTIISCMPVLLPMAALEDKIDAYFRGKLMFSCTNIKYPRANGVACIEAAWRRRILIEVKIDKDVFDKATGKFSQQLFDKKYPGQSSKDFPHLTFTILRSVPGPAGESEYTEDIVLPDGLSWPVNNISYQNLIKMLFSCYDALVENEEKQTRNIQDVYDEWEAMMDEIMGAFGINTLEKARDFLTANRNYIKIEDVPILKECDVQVIDVAGTMHEVKIENPQIQVEAQIHKDRSQEFDEIVVQNCTAGKHHLVRYTVDDVQWLVDFQFKTVTYNNKVEPLTDKHRKRILEIAPYFEEDFKRRFDNVEGTSLQKNHRCERERMCPSMLSAMEARALDMTIGQYLNHARLCREGKYSYDQIVDFVNTIYFDETPISMREERDNLIDQGRRFAAYRISMEIIAHSERMFKEEQHRSTYYHFLGSAELFSGKEVPNYSDYKKTFVRLDPHFEPTAVDLMTNITDEKAFDIELNEDSNFFSDWDQIFLSETEKKALKIKEDRLKISYFFLENLHYDIKKSTWYLEWSKRMAYYAHIISEKVNKDAGCLDYVKPYEVTYLPHFKWFWQSYEQWFELTNEQREYLYKTKGIRQKVYQIYRRSTYYIATVIKKAYEHTLGKFLGTLKYIWNKYYWFFKTLSLIGSAYAAIYLFQNFGSMFNKTEATSRVYFKKASNSIRNVIPTSINEDNFLEGVKSNILEIRVRGNCANAIGLGEHVIMCNHHLIEQFLKEKHFRVEMRPTALSLDWIEYVVYSDCIHRIPETDLVLVFCKDFPVFKRMIKKFRTEQQILKHQINNLSLYYNLGGKIHISEFPFVEIAPFIGYDNNGVRKVNSNSIHYIGSPARGSSGGILYSVDNYCNSYIIGIQCWRDNKRGYGNMVTQEMIKQAIRTFADKMIEHEGAYECLEGTSASANLITEHIQVEGIVPDEHVVGIVQKSSFEKTPIAEYFPSKRIPAILAWNDERVPRGTHPLQHSINKSGRDIMKPLDPDLLDYATNQVSIYYINRMQKYQLKITTFEETLIGLPESGNVSMNTKTSPGIPWVFGRKEPGKKDYLIISETGEVEFCAREVKEEFDRFEQSFKKGIIPKSSMYEFPKDELRPIEKALGPPIKTRSITVMNFVFNLIWRKYHMSFESYLHQEADGTNEYCIGINPESMSWSRMYDCMKAVGDYGCDLDVGNWDGHYTSQLMRAANEVTNRVYESHGLGGRKIRECLIDHNLFGNVQFLDLVLRKQRGLPSGCAGTPHLNTLGHFVLQFYLFCKLYKNKYSVLPTIDTFKKLVFIVLYGDDVAMTISPLIIDWWNGTTISEEYSKYGWPTTSAKKTSNPKQVILCEELTFLKRAFVRHTDHNITVGALERSVIEDLLHWMRRTANGKDQFADNLRNSLEYAWFHGKEYYMQLLSRINFAMRSEGLPMSYLDYEFMTLEMVDRLLDDTIYQIEKVSRNCFNSQNLVLPAPRV